MNVCEDKKKLGQGSSPQKTKCSFLEKEESLQNPLKHSKSLGECEKRYKQCQHYTQCQLNAEISTKGLRPQASHSLSGRCLRLGFAFPWQNRKGAGTNLLRKQASPRPPFPYIYAYRLLKNRLPGLRFSTSFAWDTAQLWYLGPGVGWTVAWDTLWKLLTLSRTICFAWLTF